MPGCPLDARLILGVVLDPSQSVASRPHVALAARWAPRNEIIALQQLLVLVGRQASGHKQPTAPAHAGAASRLTALRGRAAATESRQTGADCYTKGLQALLSHPAQSGGARTSGAAEARRLAESAMRQDEGRSDRTQQRSPHWTSTGGPSWASVPRQ